MSDADIIASAHEAELCALFAKLHRALASGDAFAADNFLHGVRLLAAAQEIALKALADQAGLHG